MEGGNVKWWGWMTLTFVTAFACVMCQAEQPDESDSRHVPIGTRRMTVEDVETMVRNNPAFNTNEEDQGLCCQQEQDQPLFPTEEPQPFCCNEEDQGMNPILNPAQDEEVLAEVDVDPTGSPDTSLVAKNEEEAGFQPLFQGFNKQLPNCRSPWQKKAGFFSSNTVYAGSVHHVLFMAAGGYTLELEDGSIWAVAEQDAPQLAMWQSWHDVVLLPDNIPWYAFFWSDLDFYSSYGSFRLQNLQTSATVQVSMKMGPFYDSAYTRWILAINYDTMEIWLSDNSHWEINSSDWDIFKRFQPNDTIIIGTNDGWSSYSFPNMLNNVNMYNPFYRQVKPITSRVRAVQVY